MTPHGLPPFVCPACRTSLDERSECYGCTNCGRKYPIVCKIPDLRLDSDRYLDIEADRAKAMRLDDTGGFAEAVRAYWAMTPEVPDELARRYAANAIAEEHKLGPHLARLRQLGVSTGSLVDMGCGTGGLVSAASAEGFRCVGVDIALRWLVVARKRLEQQGVEAVLVAADAARPPFAPGSFDVCTSVESLEHTPAPDEFVGGCRSVLKRNGILYIYTSNRYTLLTEPTVGLFGVGWLPRSVAQRYVARRRHTRYQFFRAMSRRELARLGAARPTASIAPGVLPAPTTPVRKAGTAAYGYLTRVGIARAALSCVGPYLELVERAT